MAAEAGATSKDVDILKDMTDYDSDEDKQAEPRPEEKKPAENKQGTYVATHTAGFKEFLLRPELLHAITDCGFEHPSEVQHRAIPQAILGTDILCQAKSGMGKTAVYVLSILQNELDKTNTSAVVVCPTRELAFQAAKEFERFAKSIAGVRVETLIGGLPIEEDRARLKKSGAPTVAVATPGRLLQLAEEGALDLSHVKHFVVDECDRVLGALDMRAEVQKVFVRTPRDKQVMMFSATLPEELRPLCRRFMHAPLEIYVDREKLTLHGLQQYFVQVLEPQKTRKLVDLLDSLEFNQCMIFVSSCKRAEQLNRLLSEINFPSTCVHSELKQDERIARYKKFKDFGSRVLVATDLFGRGVDMERVNVVFNYDMAPDEDQYLHRVGRAGRFGTKGLAISFVATKEEGEVLNKVQARFIVNIPELPDEIDASSYMGS